MTVDEKLDMLLQKVTAADSHLERIEEKMSSMDDQVTDIRLHLENVSDKNISLLAENYSNLVKKLNANNSITDQQIAYQIKVNYLMEDVEKLKKEIAELKNKIA